MLQFVLVEMADQDIQVDCGTAAQVDPGRAVQDRQHRQSGLVDMAQGSLRAEVAPLPLS